MTSDDIKESLFLSPYFILALSRHKYAQPYSGSCCALGLFSCLCLCGVSVGSPLFPWGYRKAARLRGTPIFFFPLFLFSSSCYARGALGRPWQRQGPPKKKCNRAQATPETWKIPPTFFLEKKISQREHALSGIYSGLPRHLGPLLWRLKKKRDTDDSRIWSHEKTNTEGTLGPLVDRVKKGRGEKPGRAATKRHPKKKA